VAVSKELATKLEDRLPKSKICVIENGIDTAEFANIRESRRSLTGTPPNAVKIGIAGRLVPVKRVDLFIRTAHYMANNHREFSASYHIYGDGPLREQLELLSRELGVSHLVSFEGHIPELATELGSLDILMMTSDHEGTPMVLLEALAIGVTVIAHSTGGIKDILDHGKCGFLVDLHTPYGYASELIKALRNNDRLAMHEKVAPCEHLETRYSATRNAEQYVLLYRNLTDFMTL
jgi:glycosyltransferase involved in cell wall biosynthesis